MDNTFLHMVSVFEALPPVDKGIDDEDLIGCLSVLVMVYTKDGDFIAPVYCVLQDTDMFDRGEWICEFASEPVEGVTHWTLLPATETC